MENKKVVQWNGVLFGGNANNGANCGFLYANTNNAPSNANANIGSRLYFLLFMCCVRHGRNAVLPRHRKPCHKSGHWPNDARQPGQAENKSLILGLW